MSTCLVESPDGCGVWSHPVHKDLHAILVGTKSLKSGEVLQSSALHHHVVGEKAHLRPGGQVVRKTFCRLFFLSSKDRKFAVKLVFFWQLVIAVLLLCISDIHTNKIIAPCYVYDSMKMNNSQPM